MEPIQASENMKIFFEKLLTLKKFVKEHADSSQDPILLEIYSNLHSIIKTQEEKK